MPEYLIVSSNGDWGDEFDLEGFEIFTREAWENYLEGIPEGEAECYFGTNEFVTFDSREDYLGYLTVKPILEEEIMLLVHLLGLEDTVKYKIQRGEPITFSFGLFIHNSENY